jgi:peptidoglycan/xylan/chitin deacetylase (PgdA/CDA1 family)
MSWKIFCWILAVLAAGEHTAGAADGATAVPILAYHQILESEPDPESDEITLARFEQQMQYLADHGYRTVSMDELIDFMAGGSLPEKSFVLHFDDGWTSQKLALPALRKHGFEASFWIFPERYAGMYLSWEDIRELSDDPAFEIQSHSLTHPWARDSNLVSWVDGRTPGKSPADARHELVESKRILESEIGKPVEYLAWPMGWYNDALVEMARAAGYRAALTIEPGANRPGDDVYRIKRLAVDGACDLEKFEELLATYQYPSCDGGPPPRIPSSPYPETP